MMQPISLRNPKAAFQESSSRTSGDLVLGALGVTAAAASASFAAYMMVFGPAQYVTSGTKDFGIFAHFDHRFQAVAGRQSQPPADSVAEGRVTEQAAAEPDQGNARRIDFAPTGSVPVRPAVAPAANDAPPPSPTSDADRARPLPGFVLRGVFGGNALIESNAGLSVVAPGSVLDGGGKVLSIQRHGEEWSVTSARGVIGGAGQ